MSKPMIAISMGDPAGVGPELCLRALTHPMVLAECRPVIFGSADLLRRVASRLKQPFAAEVLTPEQWQQGLRPANPAVLDIGHLVPELVEPGVVQAACGQAAFDYVKTAIEAAKRVLVAILGALVLGEKLPVRGWVGVVLIAAGVILLSLKR